MNVSVQVDMSGFNRGFALAMQYTRKTPADACNFAAKEVAFGAYKNTPVVSMETIDMELDVLDPVPVIGKRGKPLKNKKRYVTGSRDEVPFAALIIQARAKAGSNYNVLTGGRYALPQSPFKGVSRAAGAAAMAALVDAMIKSRHKTPGFFAQGWLPAFYKLKDLVSARYGGSRSGPRMTNEALGDATPAKPGQTDTYCIIENDVGLDNQNPSHNRDLLLHGTAALQSALDREGKTQLEYFLKKSGREDLEISVNAAWK